jgi:DNA-binding MarR family transcriptional regulator
LSEHRIGREIRSLNNAIRREVDNSPVKRKIDDITGTNGWIIGYIARNLERDIYQRDIEKEFGITRSTASKVLILMEKKGLVERVSVPHDARLKKLVLTQKSLELAEMMHTDANQIEARLIKGFTEDELKTFSDYILRMKKNMQRS